MSDAIPTEERPRVAVVGGGVTGLATAWHLRAPGNVPVDVTIVEASDRLGGKIRTVDFVGVPVEAGPDTFLARVPWAAGLCRELGLGDDLVAPATDKAYLWCRGRLRPLPAGLALGVPTRMVPLVRSGILSPAGAARAAADLVLPKRPRAGDPSVAEVITERLGQECLELLVEPLVGGINAGTADGLSLRSSARQLGVVAARQRSLILGLRQERRWARGAAQAPVFQSVRGGLQRIVDTITAQLGDSEVRLGTSVRAITPDGYKWRVACEPGPDVVADAVVVTVPAFAASEMLRAMRPKVADDLAAINYASVATATLAYEASAVARRLDGSGFLVPRAGSEGGLITACTWTTSKWPDLQRSGLVLLRPSAGRFGDDRALQLDDDELVAAMHRELERMLGLLQPPVESLVTRWPRSFPQYEPGHEARVARIESAFPSRSGLFFAGAAYHGLGIASCVQQALHAAARVGPLVVPKQS